MTCRFWPRSNPGCASIFFGPFSFCSFFFATNWVIFFGCTGKTNINWTSGAKLTNTKLSIKYTSRVSEDFQLLFLLDSQGRPLLFLKRMLVFWRKWIPIFLHEVHSIRQFSQSDQFASSHGALDKPTLGRGLPRFNRKRRFGSSQRSHEQEEAKRE